MNLWQDTFAALVVPSEGGESKGLLQKPGLVS